MIKNNNTNLWTACSTGRKIFKYQINKTSEIKAQSLQNALVDKFPDYLNFRTDFKVMASRLCDSKLFSQECEEMNLVPNIVAQHVVFEGHKTFDKVRNYGIKAVMGEQALDYKKPLVVIE